MQDMTQFSAAPALIPDPGLAASISRETAAPIELVTRIYREEHDALAGDARITMFLNVIVSRRVRMRLRRH